MKWTLAAALAVVLAFGTAAAEEKVLNCTDADANGFKWENGEASPTKFDPVQFTVKIYPNGNRTIVSDVFGKSIFVCFQSPDVINCMDIDDPGVSWAFKGSNFARASLYAPQLDSEPNIIVAYGNCTDF